MKLSYNWLKEYVAHELSPEKLADTLTMSGLEVEEVETMGTSLDGVVVGRVVSAEPHPNADRLKRCLVDVGDDEPIPVVCGAPNVEAGQRVPVATVGTRLMVPDRSNDGERVPLKIKKSKIRGEVSQGMICAEDELGLSDDHEGIMVLDTKAAVGEPFKAYLLERGIPFQDHVIDVSITPNRPDAISHIGAGRDVAAITRVPLVYPDVPEPTEGGDAAGLIDIEIEAPEACRRYVAMVVRGVTVQESPAWLKQRLTAVGLRPRNNIVDVTNYVMYECGQPLHGFDYDRIAGKKIVVRFSEGDEAFTTLDGKERTLPDRTLLICDAERPVALAGIMGGENSEVTDKTVNVLVESAYFDPSTIRRTAKALSMQTDASYRFERGVDAAGQVWAASRAAHLMAELGGGTVVEGGVDAHPAPVAPARVDVRHARIEKIIGVEIDASAVVDLLGRIGFHVTVNGAQSPVYTCDVPSFRPDIDREIDVIEEIARLHGYHNIPEPTHTAIPSMTPHSRPDLALRTRAGQILQGHGFRETYTNSMLREEVALSFNDPVLTGFHGRVVRTLKPISQEMAALRPSMLPGHLAVMTYNQNHGQRALRLMEFGHVFLEGDQEGAVVPGYREHVSLLTTLSGPREETSWNTTGETSTFHDMKGIVESLLDALSVATEVSMNAVYESSTSTAYRLDVCVDNQRIGVIAELARELQDAHGLRDPVYFAELNWDALSPHLVPHFRAVYRPFSRFPVVERDLALKVDKDQNVGSLMQDMRQAGGSLLQNIAVFDVYEGEQVEEGRKSVAFGLRFGAGRTLKDEEVDRSVDAIVKTLSKNYGAELRN